MHRKVCILGAGLAGLVSALRLVDRGFVDGKDIVLIEANDRPGGLMRTEIVDGFTFDVGGSHVIFSRDRSAMDFLLKFAGRAIQHRRDARILFDGQFVKYPFENGMYALPADIRFRVIYGYIRRLIERAQGDIDEPKTFKEWLYYWFGDGLVELYLEPYNRKIWKYPLEEIGISWVKGRVPNPPIEDMLKSAVGIETEGYKHQINFYYPLEGGIESLIRNMVSLLRELGVDILVDYNVSRVSIEDSKYIVRSRSGNREVTCDRLVSTIPLPTLLSVARSIFGELSSIAKKFVWTRVITIGVAIRRPRLLDYHWVYVPQHDVVFHRFAVVSNYSPSMAPDGYSSLLLEITLLPTDNSTIKSIVERAIDDLTGLGFVSRDDIVFYRAWENKFGYPIEHMDYHKDKPRIDGLLKKYGVVSLGRWGDWRYINMDAVVKSVIDGIDKHFTGRL